jgi:16S rRNA (uracil1498-N3)-methyltransferase
VRPRFHVPDLDPAADRVVLPQEEGQHLARVLRLSAGAEVDIIDGRGSLWHAVVVHADKRSAAVRAVDRGVPAPEIGVALTLVPSVIKGDKMDDVVRDAVMLGVTAIQPIVSGRSETTLAALARGERTSRWQRIAVASAKQSGRAVVPTVLPARSFADYLGEPVTAIRLMCVEPSAGAGQMGSVQELVKPPAAHVIVGPEGGWTPGEVEAATSAAAVLVTAGARTLRADAAPLVMLSALLTVWREL